MKKIELTDEEKNIVIIQLSARLRYFNDEIVNCSDSNRIRECIKPIELLESVIKKLLG